MATLSAKDGANNEYKTAYRYTVDGTAQGFSSGVVAQEPAFISTVDYDFYHLFDFPSTGVVYSKVTVVDGVGPNGSYAGKTEYAFTTPRADMVRVQTPVSETLNLPSDFYSNNSIIKNSKRWYFDIESHTAQIGRPESIKVFDGYDTEVGNSVFEYAAVLPGSQGVYTSGTVLSEFEREGTCGTVPCPPSYMKFIRTNKTYYPNVLKRVKTFTNGVSTTMEDVAWDFLTGEVKESISEDAAGTRFKSVTVPAYAKYANMKSKAENSANKHMLTQKAQNYSYKIDILGNPLKLVSASAQTWSNSWTSRRLSSSNYFEDATALTPVWRTKSSFNWNSRLIDDDGTTPLINFTDYNWAVGATQVRNWEKKGELTRFDDYTANLEAVNGTAANYSSVKYGHNNSQVLLRANNARYGEVAFSGAEDGDANGPYFGGEVSGVPFRTSDVSHTGRSSLKLTATGQKGFLFNTPINAVEGLEVGRSYRMAVWVHQPGGQSGRLVASLVDGASTTQLATASISTSGTKRAGNWSLVEGTFVIPASALNKRLIVACENTAAGTVYFDDFRFSPLDASSVAYVYDPQSWKLAYQLNNDNFFMQYEYDGRGQVAKTYVETLSDVAPRKLVSERLSNYARDVRYTITTVAGVGNGTIAPLGTSGMHVGDDLEIAATGTSCEWLLASSFRVNGTSYFGSVTLPDGGTQIEATTGALKVRNIHGNYTITLDFADQGYEPAGNWTEVGCETTSDGCYTGNSIWRQADGCGGYTAREPRQPVAMTCVNPPGTLCPSFKQSKQTQTTRKKSVSLKNRLP